jgi:hypothetical protein
VYDGNEITGKGMSHLGHQNSERRSQEKSVVWIYAFREAEIGSGNGAPAAPASNSVQGNGSSDNRPLNVTDAFELPGRGQGVIPR